MSRQRCLRLPARAREAVATRRAMRSQPAGSCREVPEGPGSEPTSRLPACGPPIYRNSTINDEGPDWLSGARGRVRRALAAASCACRRGPVDRSSIGTLRPPRPSLRLGRCPGQPEVPPLPAINVHLRKSARGGLRENGGKHHKQATCALAAKLLRRWAVLQSQRAYVIEHRAAMAASRQTGKTIRASVHEVAERLDDSGGVPSPPPEARPTRRPRQKAPATQNRVERSLPCSEGI